MSALGTVHVCLAYSASSSLRPGGGPLCARISVSRSMSTASWESSPLAPLDTVDQLRAQDVDPAVQQPAAVGDLLLLPHEVVDLNSQVVVGQRCEIG